ncbi:methylated-DNA--[protein]-cysteine S-methyltransferase [Streptomyces sp. TRM 70351]|uniref:methylated-DNA--[protein]-cysteine S-methyltransferase n=1 Tax=Streptomyces sp. TRM 70351 TaxID=3116552 RepID=UPI002E7BF82D|nr:methylated-DNA--[protein]-cysteine S-methyltransferase [Streptomyces sp. TRM 70351]MEE1930364.1 methylated-DNA--[protein]-cysteine S-methyltransferase [Streptomyces sp. TRM 70351]
MRSQETGRAPQPRTYTVVDSPFGPLTLVAAGARLCGLYMHEQRHRPPQSAFGTPADGVTGVHATAAAQLAEYFAGRRTVFTVPLALSGTPFQRTVWEALPTIPHGRTVTYGELAARVGNPAASRAVGLANGRNPVGVIVPCHRVVGANGALTGYGGGLERKRRLLDHESATLTAGAPPEPAGLTARTG